MRKKKEMIKPLKNDIPEVETWDGLLAPRDECKRIDGKYYRVNVDCFLVQNEKGDVKWTRKNTGRIAFDYEKNKWDLTKRLRENPDYVEGIIDSKGGRGYFILNPYTNVLIVDNLKHNQNDGVVCVNKNIALEMGCVEDFTTGCYVKNNIYITSAVKRKMQTKEVYLYPKMRKLSYNADENNTHYLNIIKEYNKNKSKIELDPLTTQASKLFGNYSFGLEIETCNGYIPPQMLGPLGIVPLKDGSLRRENGVEPYEYTSIPLSGELGLQTVKLQFEELNKRCEINQKCSLHIHIGGVNKRTEEFVIAFYKLCYNIQDEVFEIFPDYKSYPEKYGLHKNYCNKLPDLKLNEFNFSKKTTIKESKNLVKQAFDRIYYWASDNAINETNECWNLNTKQHPRGKMDKWNYNARYSYVNFHNFLFSERGTLEYRLHTPTLNFIKASNWLFIVSAITQFAEQFTNEILKDEVIFDLKTILNCYKNYFFKSFYETDYSEIAANYLIDYVEFRKKIIKQDIENGDGFGTSIEFNNDSNFKFSSQGINSLY